MANSLRMIDVAVNLTDDMFKGFYNGKQSHENDLESILNKAFKRGVEKIVITGTDHEDSIKALEMAQTHENLFCTVGIHPTRCSEFVGKEDQVFQSLRDTIKNGGKKVVAIGEFGLDWERIQFCPKEVQLEFFEKQFVLAEETGLPLFLHMRDAAEDFVQIVKKNRSKFSRGVAHSFTGTAEEAAKIIELDLYIGINGCSLKTEENLAVVKSIPAERIIIETDAPWCDVRPSHAGFKYIKTSLPSKDKKKFDKEKAEEFTIKGRNEPCNVIQILEIIAGCKEMEVQKLSEIVFKNATDVFFPNSQ